jgi:hypothetical protein
VAFQYEASYLEAVVALACFQLGLYIIMSFNTNKTTFLNNINKKETQLTNKTKEEKGSSSMYWLVKDKMA